MSDRVLQLSAFLAMLMFSGCGLISERSPVSSFTENDGPNEVSVEPPLTPTGSVPEAGEGVDQRAQGDRSYAGQIREAVLELPRLLASAEAVDIASASVKSARSAFRPQISIGVEGGGYQTRRDEGTEVTGAFRGRQLLFDGFQTRNQVAAARSRLEVAEEERLALASNLALRAVRAYHDVLQQRQLVALAEEDLAVHQSLASQIRERVEAGAGTETDQLRADTRLANADSRLILARANLRRAEAVFAELFRKSPEMLDVPTVPPLLDPVEVRENLKDNPILLAADARVADLEARLRAAKGQRVPTVALEVSAQRQVTDTITGQDYQIFAGLAGEYDLFTGGRVSAAIAEAEARLFEAGHDRAAVELELTRQLEDALVTLDSSIAELAALERSVEANRASVVAILEQFSIGRRGLIELLDSQRDYASARSALINAETTHALSRYEVLALSGGILSFFGIEADQLRTHHSPRDRRF